VSFDIEPTRGIAATLWLLSNRLVLTLFHDADRNLLPVLASDYPMWKWKVVGVSNGYSYMRARGFARLSHADPLTSGLVRDERRVLVISVRDTALRGSLCFRRPKPKSKGANVQPFCVPNSPLGPRRCVQNSVQ
jgi:hypothetical protein